MIIPVSAPGFVSILSSVMSPWYCHLLCGHAPFRQTAMQQMIRQRNEFADHAEVTLSICFAAVIFTCLCAAFIVSIQGCCTRMFSLCVHIIFRLFNTIMSRLLRLSLVYSNSIINAFPAFLDIYL